MKYKFSTLTDGIYLLEFEHKYDLAMHFLRAQEYYECPNPEFRDKIFNLWDYIEWYAKDHNNNFSYPADWDGFNIPGRVLRRLYLACSELPSENKYDEFMRGLVQFINIQDHGDNFYLIGAAFGDKEAINHELAHGLWALNEDYATEQKENIAALDNKIISKLRKKLIELGYTEDVLDDEIQAYLSISKQDAYLGEVKMSKKLVGPFIKTFKKYSGGINGK